MNYYFLTQSSADLVITKSSQALQQGFEYSKIAVVAALAAGVAAQVIKSLRN